MIDRDASPCMSDPANSCIKQESPSPVLRKVLIKNYRAFKDFKLEFSRGVNVIVGSNDAGKSTLLEAINLALTARVRLSERFLISGCFGHAARLRFSMVSSA